MSKAFAARLNFDSVLWGVTFLLAAALIVLAHLPLSGASGMDAPQPVAARSLADIRFETAAGYVESLAQTNGHVRIVTTFYSHCPGACPLAFDSLRRIEDALPPAQRAKLQIVALTLDPQRDTQVQLRSYEQDRRLDGSRWTLGRASARDIGVAAKALGASFRILEDGSVDHLSSFILLDVRGREIARTARTQSVDAQFAAAVRAALGV
jgi:protein SCO1